MNALHMLFKGLTDLDPNTTIISTDGISAFDKISRAAMLEGLMNVEGEGKSGANRQDVLRFSIVLSVGGCVGSDAHHSPRRRRRTKRSIDASLFLVGSTQRVSGNTGISAR